MGINAGIRLITLPSLLAQGMSGNQAFAYFQSIGIGGRRQIMQAEYRRMASLVRYEQPIRNLKDSTLIPKQFMTEAPLRRSANYRVVGDASIIDEESGVISTRKVSMYTDDSGSKTDLTDQYQETIQAANYQPGETVLSVNWYVVEHNEGFVY